MPVHGSGPVGADFMVVGNAPNYRDVRAGVVFSGPTGEEVWRLLAGCGLTGRAFLTNIWREQQDDEDAANNAQLYTEGVRALRGELQRVRPRHIITLGRDATRLFLGDVDMDDTWGLHLLPDAEAWTRLPELRRDATILPQTHPAAGFHSPEASSQVLVGFENLRRVLQKRLSALGLYDDPHPHPAYTVLQTAGAVAAWMQGVDVVAMDTEGYLHAPWSIQLSKQAGSAVLVRANNAEAMQELRLWMPKVTTVTMHAGLHDLRVLRVMGIDLVGLGTTIEDTQLMAFELGVIPQGLKSLATRELRMQMQSYQEVLGDAQNRHATTYLSWLWDELHAEWEAQCVEDFGFQRDVLKRRIKVVPKLPRSQLFKAVERVMRSTDPARLWGDQILDLRVAAHKRLGPMPEASLSDVAPETALRYAARDADATHRLRDVLRPRITDMQLDAVYALDLSTYPIIDRMMQVGIMPDVPAFQALGTKLQGEIATLKASLCAVTGHADFNPNSGDQVAAYLFDELRLEPLGKRTSSGRESTNDKVLEALEKYYQRDHPQIADIRAYREFYKLLNTFCVAPETRVLTADLRWIPAGEVNEASELMGFDEHVQPGGGQRRKWQITPVKDVHRVSKPCYRLTLVDGTSVVCSAEHQWLVRSAGTYKKLRWARTDELLAANRLGSRGRNREFDYEIVKPLDVWQTDDTREGGWLAGILDGEGYVGGGSHGLNCIVSQNYGDVLSEIAQQLDKRGFGYGVTVSPTGNYKLGVLGVKKTFELLGSVRPIRLLNDLRRRKLPSIGSERSVRVAKREYLGLREVVAIETGSHTFIAEGLASHNCLRLPELIYRWPRDSRIHCDLFMNRVPSGRLNARNPNLLAMPKHGKFAKDFRRCFVPGPGRMFLSADESQAELRVLAHLSQDPVMLAIFRGEKRNRDGSIIDLHAAMAQRIFGIEPRDQDESKHRLPAKAVNFGLPMGMTAVGLCLELRKGGLDVSENDVQRWIDDADALYTKVPVYKARCVAEAEQNGFVRCLSGRIRYIGGIRSRDDRVKSEAERFAFSTPIQEGAQFVGKTALASAWSEVFVPLQKAGRWCEPLLWVHDDLLSEMEDELILEVAPKLKRILTTAPKGFTVPLETRPEAGLSWAELVKV